MNDESNNHVVASSPPASSRAGGARELVRKWRSLGEFFATNTDQHQRDGAKLLQQCADELEAVLHADAARPRAPQPAELFPKDDGLWLQLSSPDGQEAWLNLSTQDHGPIVNAVIAETHRRLTSR